MKHECRQQRAYWRVVSATILIGGALLALAGCGSGGTTAAASLSVPSDSGEITTDPGPADAGGAPTSPSSPSSPIPATEPVSGSASDERGEAPPPRAIDPTTLLGRWLAEPTSPSFSLLIGPAVDGSSSFEGWGLDARLESLVRVRIVTDPDGQVTLEGSRWRLGRGGAADVVRERATITADRQGLDLVGSGLRLTRRALMDPAGVITEDPVGAWSGSFGGGLLRVDVGFGADGGLAGVSSSGCRISGAWRRRVGAPWIEVAFVLDCDAGPQSFAGVASLGVSTSSTQALTIAATGTGASASSAIVFALRR